VGKKDKLFYKDLPALKFFLLMPILVSVCYPFNAKSDPQSLTHLASQYLEGFEYTGYGLFILVSVFLMTSLALREKEHLGKFSIKRYLVRRILRLMPLYLLIVFVSYVVAPMITDFFRARDIDLPPWYWILSFSSNYYNTYFDYNYFYALKTLWSIGLLIQINVVIAIILRFASKKVIPTIGIAFVIAGVLTKVILEFMNFNIQWLPFDYFIYIGFGLTLGALVRNKNGRVITFFKTIELKKILTIYIIGLCLTFLMILVLTNTKFGFLAQLGSSLFVGFIILDQIFNKRRNYKLRNLNLITNLGNYSYGLYMYAGITVNFGLFLMILLDLEESMSVKILFPIFCILVTVIFALASYKIFEKPFLRFRRKIKRA
jgi:peptidoglycan/LPS O-acetylase OafA/YrhL